MPPIGIITDFGEKDYFVGSMKGVILSINPKAQIIDITHEISKHDIRSASFILANAAKTFPKGTVFLVVIDPGVGTKRKCISLKTKNGLTFVGPDNGVFTQVSEDFGIQEIREVSNKNLMRSTISNTFHGRDVMAPVAAHLSLGIENSKIGPELEEIKLLEIEKPEISKGEIKGEILHIDDFGNVVTNIKQELVKKIAKTGGKLEIRINKERLEAPFVDDFSRVPKGNVLCYIGSAGVLEIAKNQGNLADDLKVERNSKVHIKTITQQSQNSDF